ncbi:MAG: outer membrane protein transport protein [Roseobacter sp.]|jgi:long-subunit fatty acid transport protein
MSRYIKTVTVLCLTAGGAHAGALDRTGQSVDVLFEEGRYLEFSLGYLSPDIKGESVTTLGGPAPFFPTFPAGGKSGDIGESNFNFGAAYKADINEDWSYAIIFDEPYKAEVDYPDGTGYFAQGSKAKFNSVAITTLLQYNLDNGFSVYGGPRFQRADAKAQIGFVAGYDVDTDKDWGIGYVIGAAYERPDIALRVSLTYSSEIKHKNDVEESFSPPSPLLAPLFPGGDSTADYKTPDSINLAFQTGIAADTLLFGGVRWVDWSEFDLSPKRYVEQTGQPLLSYEDDVITYTLGLGRRLTENWSLAGSVGYEKNTGNLFTNLGPADGQKSIGLAAIYTQGKVTVTTGIRYAWIGDTTTAVQGNPAAEFDDNNAVAIGVKVGYNF